MAVWEMGGRIVGYVARSNGGTGSRIALCAAINLAYFLQRAVATETLPRRAAAFLLFVMSLGTLAESVVIIASLQAVNEAAFTSVPWIVARSITLAAIGCVSALVVRAMGDRK